MEGEGDDADADADGSIDNYLGAGFSAFKCIWLPNHALCETVVFSVLVIVEFGKIYCMEDVGKYMEDAAFRICH